MPKDPARTRSVDDGRSEPEVNDPSLTTDARDADPRGGPQRNARLEDLRQADTIIDARSPAEYAIDHVPGAINCPVLSNEERHIVGTLYKQRGAFEARRVGGAMVAANLAAHLHGPWADRPHDWQPIVYCWRGGLRSGSMVQWLRLVGWNARQLAGGYKRYRQHVIASIDAIAPTLELRVVCGPTGSAKTRVLQALGTLGCQTLDLEAFARHRGSVLGALPGVVQPSQKRFETLIADTLERIDPERPLYVEAESRKIGRLALPTSLLERLRASPCVAIDASFDARLAFLLDDYAFLGDDRADLVARIESLHGLQSNETLARWARWAEDGALEPLFADMVRLHYDPLYARAAEGVAARAAPVATVSADALEPSDIERIAREIVAAEGARQRAAAAEF